MKVFLSWSGNLSHQVAKCLRDWLPSVIQNIEPYVSSEDIDKGARWSSDIATELENSTFGVLCVTRENLQAPWLNFEAGALSKTMDKTFVSPFLYDVKRSEVNGPVLQFQSTIFEKEDIRKMMKTLNKALETGALKEERLDKAFDVWYPSLEESLKKIKSTPEQTDQNPKDVSSDLFEEMLDLTRLNQKLLRSLEEKHEKMTTQFNNSLEEVHRKIEYVKRNGSTHLKKFHPMMIDEILHITHEMDGINGIEIVLGLFKDDLPWLYSAGISLCKKLESKGSEDDKRKAMMQFERLMEFSFEHPVMREAFGNRKEFRMIHRDIHHIFMRYFERNL